MADHISESQLRALLPYVAIDGFDDGTGSYWCKAEPPCRPGIGVLYLEDCRISDDNPEYVQMQKDEDHCYEHGFPHTDECPLNKLLLAAKSSSQSPEAGGAE